MPHYLMAKLYYRMAKPYYRMAKLNVTECVQLNVTECACCLMLLSA